MRNARRLFPSPPPLPRADAVKECLNDLVYDPPARGKSPRTVTSLAENPGQQSFSEVVDMFAERIEPGEFIYPWRFASPAHISRPVSMNPYIVSGRLVVFGTRIPANFLLGGKQAGETVEDIAKDFSLDLDIVQKALVHLGVRQKAA